MPPPNRRARRAAAAAAAKHSTGAAAAGARGEEEQQAARLRTAVLRGHLAVSSAKLRATGVLYAAELAAGGVYNSELAASEREIRELVAEVQCELELAAALEEERLQLELDLKAALQLKELLCLAPPLMKEHFAASVAEGEAFMLPYLLDEQAVFCGRGCRAAGGRLPTLVRHPFSRPLEHE